MKNKYHVAPKEDRTADGITFHSKKEMLAYVNTFRPLMRSGIQVEMQKPFLLCAYTPKPDLMCQAVGEYLADFVVTEKDGTVRVYDVKGFSTPEYKLKKKIFSANYPHLRIVEL